VIHAARSAVAAVVAVGLVPPTERAALLEEQSTTKGTK